MNTHDSPHTSSVAERLRDAAWIGTALVGNGQVGAPAAMVRRSFTLTTKPASAHLTITALGLYEPWMNGRRVGREELAPGWTDYRQRLNVQTHDVTAFLRAGTNRVGAWLGDGWCCGRVAAFDRGVSYEARPALRAELRVEEQDGRVTRWTTDETWQWFAGPILAGDLIDGEHYDARREIKGWCDPDAPRDEDTSWQPVVRITPDHEPAVLTRSAAPPVRVTQELKPIADPRRGGGGWLRDITLFDFGQNFTGKVRLAVKGPAGLTLRLRYAEVLTPDGQRLDRSNLRSAAATDSYTLRGDPDGETWTPCFTFHGFRYVEVSWAEQWKNKRRDTPLQPFDRDTLTGLAMHNDMKRTGHFETGHALINRLQTNIVWGQRSNFLEAPTDCPQRDERLGWTGDAQVFAPTAAFNYDVSGFFDKWLDDLADSQLPDGEIPHVAPNVVEHVDSAAGWSDAVILVPWAMFRAYGNMDTLARQYPVMKRWIDFQCRTAVHGVRGSEAAELFTGFGDWLALDGEGKGMDGFNTATPKTFIGTAYHAHSLAVFARIAARLGHSADAEEALRCRSLAIDAFTREFVREGKLTVATQTAHLMALAFDLLPEAQRAGVFDDLLGALEAQDHHLTTGFLGTPLLCDVLTRFGRIDMACDLLLTETYPGWLYPVTLGATTMWERWNSWHPDRGFVDLTMNSLNHYAYGAVGDWMYRHLAGIQLDLSGEGGPSLEIQPYPDKRLGRCRASLDSPIGRIESAWELEGSHVRFEVTIPEGATAMFARAQTSRRPIGPGSHRFDEAV